ncbi:uncharacterized protein G2W53_014210 [Senna tora]|uniref:GAG-pre-integrase domain-containing protein n=1 Tax=Senna tora TaxID=362788 RepID=A0A834WT38_9FABA|nr:uncharacterized protein G2W53_014210 [Senna tora]
MVSQPTVQGTDLRETCILFSNDSRKKSDWHFEESRNRFEWRLRKIFVFVNLEAEDYTNLQEREKSEMEDTGNDGKMISKPDAETKNQDKTHGGWTLHNSDQPVKTALEAKDKLGCVDGSIKPPKDPVEHKRWKPVDSMVKSWLTNSLTKELSESFLFCNSAKELWDNIAERYSVSNGPKFYQVQRQMVSLEQGGETVTCYFNKLNRSWDELNRIKPVPRCVCGLCTCQINKRLDEHDSDIKLVQFLMGLQLMFDALRGQILNLDPLPSVNKAFSMVVRQETQKEVNLAFNNVESSAMMVKTTGRRAEDRKADKAGKYCDNCNQNGHTRESCFKIIGFPDWFKELKEQKKKAGKKAGNAANMVADTPIDFAKDKENIDLAGVLSALQELAKVVKNKADEQVNFVNIRASSHMCSNKNLMTGLRILTKPIPVHLPDGSTKHVKMIGNDQRTRKTLIEGEVAGNLYVLRQTNVVEKLGNHISNTKISTCNHANHSITAGVTLWHHRLGHAAVDSIKHIDDASRISHIGEIVEAGQRKELGEINAPELEIIREENPTSDLGGSKNRDGEGVSTDGSNYQQGEESIIEEGSQELELQGNADPTFWQDARASGVSWMMRHIGLRNENQDAEHYGASCERSAGPQIENGATSEVGDEGVHFSEDARDGHRTLRRLSKLGSLTVTSSLRSSQMPMFPGITTSLMRTRAKPLRPEEQPLAEQPVTHYHLSEQQSPPQIPQPSAAGDVPAHEPGLQAFLQELDQRMQDMQRVQQDMQRAAEHPPKAVRYLLELSHRL